MTTSQLHDTHGTARIPADNVVSRSMTIFKTVAEVRRAWDESGIPGEPEIKPAPGNRGAIITVELPKSDEESYKGALSSYKGNSISQKLEVALRELKGRLETGEVATTDGQPSGRSE